MAIPKANPSPETIHVLAFPRWKWPHVRRAFPGQKIRFVADSPLREDIQTLLLWGRAPVPDWVPSYTSILRMEDGFLRSVGLGAELTQPLSWVVDRKGIYYDATQPSELEDILQNTHFSEGELVRAQALRQQIVTAGLTKYNVGSQRPWNRPAGDRRVILVPGQVESDASIQYGSPVIKQNITLLQRVRDENPDAYIVYKAHPDVAAGLRRLGEGEDQARQWCDAVLPDIAMDALLQQVDEVHVLTSLTGFEALLRGLPVTCYGQPFYSGWGLTTDLYPNPRRGRHLQLEELMAGSLLRYPLYFGRGRKGRVEPEEALEDLELWKQRKGGKPPFWQGTYRFFLRRFIGVR